MKRLAAAMQDGADGRLAPGFGLSQAQVTFIAHGDWTLPDARAACSRIVQSCPDFLILHIGSNDLGSVRFVDSIKIANDLLELAHYLCQASGAHGAIICHLTQRGLSHRLPSRSHVDHYNDKILMANRFIQEVIGAGLGPQLISWPHKGMIQSTAHLLGTDGTHVNTHGQFLLYKSLRGAVICAAKAAGACPPAQ